MINNSLKDNYMYSIKNSIESNKLVKIISRILLNLYIIMSILHN